MNVHQASGGVKRDPRALKALQFEYQRLMSTAGVFSDLSQRSHDDAVAARELKAVESCLSSLEKEALSLLGDTKVLKEILDDAKIQVGCQDSHEIKEVDAILAVSRALALVGKLEGRALAEPLMLDEMRSVLTAWRAGINVGTFLDVFWEGVWYHCKVKINYLFGCVFANRACTEIRFKLVNYLFSWLLLCCSRWWTQRRASHLVRRVELLRAP
jgi:hypothetical protein